MAAASSHSRSSSASSGAADSDSSGGGRQQQQRQQRPGQGLFRAMQRGLMGLGSKLQGSDQPLYSNNAGAGTTSQQQQAEEAARAAQLIAQQWQQLSQLCWCPVLAEAPDSALPWRDSSSRAQGAGLKAQRLAAPCAVRPLKDLWLVSAVKAVVDGECQSQVALAGLGW